MARSDGIDGYLADETYPSTFQREFAPPWIDAVLRHRGFVPPRRPRGPFRLLDLGCGEGIGLIALAAAHPEGAFVGVDAMPEHIAVGEAAARALGLANIAFRCARFADMEPPAQADFDYVTGQGLIAWISEENRRHVYRIAAQHLRSGGIACLGYNVMPGWREMLAFQRLVLLLAAKQEGSATARFAAALDQVRAMNAAGAAALSDWLMEWIGGLIAKLPAGYFAHEYLNEHWQPLWSASVMEAMAGHGFAYLGPSRVDRLREDFCMRKAQRAELAKIADPMARETAADIFTESGFRVDIYGRDMARAPHREEARLDGWWAAAIGESEAQYTHRTAGGTLKFDNGAAHAILDALEAGPMTLRAIREGWSAGTAADVLNAADALFISGQIVPADPPADIPSATAVNADLIARNRAGSAIYCLVGRHGALPIARETMLADGEHTAAALRRIAIR